MVCVQCVPHDAVLSWVDIVGCIQVALANRDRTRRGIAAQLVKMGLVGSGVELKKKRPTKGTGRVSFTS